MSKKYLVIVESPTKQKTIGRILGSEYIVKSSMGHIRDLPAKELGVDEEKNFKPKYMIIPKSKKNIATLKTAAKDIETLFLATDHDREGESIAWHLAEVLKKPKVKTKRITFNEITKTAVLNSLKGARDIDFNLVEAQQARRILDRLVGYKLSPLLWKKIARGLSAGRVQSVAVRLLSERAKEIEKFNTSVFWGLRTLLEKTGVSPQFEARLLKWDEETVEKTEKYKLFAEDYTVKKTIFNSEKDISAVADYLKNNSLTVSKLEKKETRQKPRPPFITSSLQQDAYTRLGFSASKTMQTAQTLYEGVNLDKGDISGLITYMRTDSFNVSKDIQGQSKKFIEKNYGKEFAPLKTPVYHKKVKGAQEAHEAIHPTDVFKTPQSIKQRLTSDQYKLYELIWLRFVASQMADAVFNSLSVDITAGDIKEPKCILRANGRSVKFEGYRKVYSSETEKGVSENTILPDMKEGDELKLLDITTKEHKTQPPPSYNDASLIKTLEKHGIGRPSTYAPIIKTIIDRKYIEREKGAKLVVTSLGTIVTEKLKDFFPDIMELSYTAGIETKLDDIADGKAKWSKVIEDFYKPFTNFLAKAYKSMKAPEPVKTDEKCPLCKSPMLMRESRFGKYLSCSKYPECKGKMPLDKDGKKIVPEVTDKKCPECSKAMVIKTGRRGRFLACSDYPNCKTTCSLDGEKGDCFTAIKTDRPCDKCKSPLVLRKSRRGFFLGCSKFPKCKNIVTVTIEEVGKIQADAKSS